MFELRHYTSSDGVDLFTQWLGGLRDKQAQARVAARLASGPLNAGKTGNEGANHDQGDKAR